ncbi:MAG TPA: cytochrome C [Flavobacteriaceae bacterium]|jgi:mono/diheme cytochrome c family protein|nr:cytochrome C [Flavobacteriaceae bacterium]HAT64214.1 cytochrome C [Flavobacteriaceae bacterium]|tara:strand:- start:2479 stop:2976 length:498 start_codon:yes stop_codon:yes gene_type:complete
MKLSFKILAISTLALFLSCGEKDTKKEEKISIGTTQPKKEEVKKEVAKASETIDLTNKGIGPITSVTLDAEINSAMALKGEEVFKAKCTACHKIGKKFIGPAPNKILERRTPEWVMNMILNPEEMTQKDPLAKQLLIEFNGSPMANQGLTEKEARSILEYFRTLE